MGRVCYKIPHPLDNTRKLFLSYDYTHLIKDLTDNPRKRFFTINGSKVTFSTVTQIYDLQKTSDELKPVYNFHRKTINSSNLEWLKVKYFLQVYQP